MSYITTIICLMAFQFNEKAVDAVRIISPTQESMPRVEANSQGFYVVNYGINKIFLPMQSCSITVQQMNDGSSDE